MGFVLTLAVDQKKVKAIGCEDALALQGRRVLKTKIEDTILKPAITCRKALQEMMDAHTALDGKKFVALLTEKRTLLCGFYKQWIVEEGFWVGMEGPIGLAFLQAQAEELLPTADKGT